LNAHYRCSKLRFEHRAAIHYDGKTGNNTLQSADKLVFASSTRSIQTTQRYIDGDAQRKLLSMI
jgi:hypothetical protein